MNRPLATVSEGALMIRVWNISEAPCGSGHIAVMTKQYRHPEQGTTCETHQLTADDLLALPNLAQKAHKAMIALQGKEGVK